MLKKEDIEIAKKARLNAYAPYSNFFVGVALRTKNDKVYSGCNIENYGIQAICAERTAFAKALSEGEREFKSITIVGAPKGKEPIKRCMPCGYCRQFMSEFIDKNFRIYVVNGDDIEEYGINDVLPNAFTL